MQGATLEGKNVVFAFKFLFVQDKFFGSDLFSFDSGKKERELFVSLLRVRLEKRLLTGSALTYG